MRDVKKKKKAFPEHLNTEAWSFHKEAMFHVPTVTPVGSQWEYSCLPSLRSNAWKMNTENKCAFCQQKCYQHCGEINRHVVNFLMLRPIRVGPSKCELYKTTSPGLADGSVSEALASWAWVSGFDSLEPVGECQIWQCMLVILRPERWRQGDRHGRLAS